MQPPLCKICDGRHWRLCDMARPVVVAPAPEPKRPARPGEGRPRMYETNAAKQRAYRERRKESRT